MRPIAAPPVEAKSEKRKNFDKALASLGDCGVKFCTNVWFGLAADNEGFAVMYRGVPMTVLCGKAHPTVGDYISQIESVIEAIDAELELYHKGEEQVNGSA